MKAKSALIASIATVGIASSANAQDFTSAGGTPVAFGVQTVDIVIGASGTIADLDVTTNWASHVWMGDINASLTHVDTATTVSLFGFVGSDVSPAFGDGSDLVGAYRFDDESANSFWAAAAAAPEGAGVVAPGTYQATAVGSNTQTFLSAFDGENMQGTWRLTITDTYSFSNGSLTNFTVHMTVPAPGALGVLGLAGIAGLGRRRSRR